MDEKFLLKVSPLIKNAEAWAAFLAIIDQQRQVCIKGLIGSPSPNDCLRISAELTLLDRLSKQQDRLLNQEKRQS